MKLICGLTYRDSTAQCDTAQEKNASHPAESSRILGAEVSAVRANIAWKKVTSSQINEIGYDLATLTLGIRFHPSKKQVEMGEMGTEYHFYNITPEIYAEFEKAPSQGEFLSRRLKPYPDTFPFLKIGPVIPEPQE